MEEGRQYRMNPDVFQAASTGDSSLKLADSNSSTFLQVTIGKNTVLHVALQFKKIDAAKDIVNLCPRLVYETNSKGNTPLHVAASVGDSSMVKLLIDQAKKLDVETGGQQQLLSMVNQDGDTALHVAVRYGNFEVVEELIKEKDPAELAKQLNNAGESALFLAVDRQNYRIASHILRNAPDCSYNGRHGMNVLHAVVLQTTSNYINMVDWISQINFEDLKYKFLRGIWRNPLPEFLTHRTMKLRQRLRGARSTIPEDINTVDSISQTNYKDLERQASGFVFERGIVTLMWIISMLFLSPLPESLTHGTLKHRLRPARATFPLGIVFRMMYKWPRIIDQQDDSGRTPLHIAAHTGNREFVMLLLEINNSSAYVINKEGLSALHIAAKEDNVDVMEEIIMACPGIYELLDSRGKTALHVAAESGARDAVTFFLTRREFVGFINEKDEDGNTPLHLAAINRNYQVLSLLGHQRGVDLYAKNKQDITIMDIVFQTNQDYMHIGIWNLDPSSSRRVKLAGEGNGNGEERTNFVKLVKQAGDGDGKGKGKEGSNFVKQVSETNLLVATLIATVTFTAAFTVPGGFKQNEGVDEGLAVLSKKTAFRVFLIANTIAFGLSTTSIFVNFLASMTIREVEFHREVLRRAPIFTNWSIGALLVAFTAGTYTVVPHFWGITVGLILCCGLLISLFFPLLIK